MKLAIAAAALLAASAPKPGEIKLFKDWIVGCDNAGDCQAVALMPIDDYEASTLVVSRKAGANAEPEIVVERDADAPATVRIDGKAFPLKAQSPSDPSAFVAALLAGRKAEVAGSAVSTAGAAAAFLYMDEKQGRIGTTTALARQGSRPAITVRAPALPVITAPPLAPASAALRLDAARIRSEWKKAECDVEEEGPDPRAAEISALDRTHSLLLLSCGSGAYNFLSVPLLLTANADEVTVARATFDAPTDGDDPTRPLLVNAYFDPKTGLLETSSKGRGIGDCGVARSFVWDGTHFRLVAMSEMPECRGSPSWIPIWRAEVRRR